MSNEQDIKDIVAQLDRLQIQQSELLQRLDQLVGSGESNNATARSVQSVQSEITREFAIGDRVRIRNPGLLQAVRGTIIKIGASRITVQARNGNKIVRAPKNLILEE
jgi:transcription elongation factor